MMKSEQPQLETSLVHFDTGSKYVMVQNATLVDVILLFIKHFRHHVEISRERFWKIPESTYTRTVQLLW